jgi:hypothetical protein
VAEAVSTAPEPAAVPGQPVPDAVAAYPGSRANQSTEVSLFPGKFEFTEKRSRLVIKVDQTVS